MQGKCQPCHASCRTCKDNTLCTSCKEGYFNSTNMHFSYCQTCSTGCKACTSGTSCQSCNPGYLLGSGACTVCGSDCVTCTSLTVCTQCSITSTLIAGICYLCTDPAKSGSAGCQACQTVGNLTSCTKTAVSYYLNNGQSVPCPTAFANSLYCNSTGPIQCQNDYHSTLTSRYHLVSGQCVANSKSCKMMKNTAG
jgi:hypothetical protein